MRKIKRVLATVCAMTCMTMVAPTQAQMTAVKAETTQTSQSTTTNMTVPVTDEIGNINKYSKGDVMLTPAEHEKTVSLSVTENMALQVYVYAYAPVSGGAVEPCTAVLKKADGTVMASQSVAAKEDTTIEFSKCSTIVADTFVEPGNYTLHLSNAALQKNVKLLVYVAGYRAPLEEELIMGQVTSGYIPSGKTVYKKITMDQSGIVMVQAMMKDRNTNTQKGATMVLCDDNKDDLTASYTTQEADKYAQIYALKQGVYYIKLIGDNSYYAIGGEKQNCKLAKAKKSKALKVTKKKTAIMPVDFDGDTAWFRFTVNKPKKIKANLTFWGTGSVQVTVYQGNKKINQCKAIGNQKCYSFWMRDKKTKNTINWKKGTYYVKVQKVSDETNGKLQIKLN